MRILLPFDEKTVRELYTRKSYFTCGWPLVDTINKIIPGQDIKCSDNVTYYGLTKKTPIFAGVEGIITNVEVNKQIGGLTPKELHNTNLVHIENDNQLVVRYQHLIPSVVVGEK